MGAVFAGLGEGDDGDLEYGVVWPNPRFTGNGNGTITDNLTGLTWLKNANCFGTISWASALTSCNNLASGSCGLTDSSSAGDWRLPNVKELHSLVHYGFSIPTLPNAAGTGKWSSGDPFTDVQLGTYWTSSTFANYTTHAHDVSFYYGQVWTSDKINVFWGWPGRGGN